MDSPSSCPDYPNTFVVAYNPPGNRARYPISCTNLEFLKRHYMFHRDCGSDAVCLKLNHLYRVGCGEPDYFTGKLPTAAGTYEKLTSTGKAIEACRGESRYDQATEWGSVASPPCLKQFLALRYDGTSLRIPIPDDVYSACKSTETAAGGSFQDGECQASIDMTNGAFELDYNWTSGFTYADLRSPVVGKYPNANYAACQQNRFNQLTTPQQANAGTPNAAPVYACVGDTLPGGGTFSVQTAGGTLSNPQVTPDDIFAYQTCRCNLAGMLWAYDVSARKCYQSPDAFGSDAYPTKAACEADNSGRTVSTQTLESLVAASVVLVIFVAAAALFHYNYNWWGAGLLVASIGSMAGYYFWRRHENALVTKEVFAIKSTVASIDDATAACKGVGADGLATLAQLVYAQQQGAQWCEPGWVDDPNGIVPAAYPVRDPAYCDPKHANPDMQTGTNPAYKGQPVSLCNCYGIKPSASSVNGVEILPFNAEQGQWSIV